MWQGRVKWIAAVVQLPSCPMDCSTPGFPVLYYLPELAQTHVHWVDGAIQPFHALWILYNYVEWKSSWGKQNEVRQSYVRLLFIYKWRCVYGGIGRGFSIISSFWKTKWLILTSTCSQLDKLKAALDKKHLELVKRKCLILHQDNSRPRFFDDQAKNCYSLAGKFWFIHHSHQTLHLQIFTYFGLYKILLRGKSQFPGRP